MRGDKAVFWAGIFLLLLLTSVCQSQEVTLSEDELSEKADQVALDWIETNREHIVELSDTIWEYAEPPFEEFQT